MHCDVVGCKAVADHSFLMAELHRSMRIRVCLQHFTCLIQGQQPDLVAERFDLAQLGRRPAVLLSSRLG